MTMSGRMGAFMTSGRGAVGVVSVDMSESTVWIETRGRTAAVVEDIVVWGGKWRREK